MIFFELLINFIEAFFYTFFICHAAQIKQKSLYLCLVTCLHFMILNVSFLTHYYGLLLTIFIISFMILSIYIFKRKLNFHQVYLVVLYNAVIILSILPSVLLIQLIQKSVYISIDYNILYILRCVFAKLIQIICTFLLLKYYTISYTLDINSHKSIIIYEFFMVLLIGMIVYSLTVNQVTMNVLYMILLLSIIAMVLFQRILFKVEKMNKEKIQLWHDKHLLEFNKQKYNTIYNVKTEMETIDHRLFYTVYKIDEYLKNKEYDKIKNIINDYKSSVLKYKISIDTGNDIFDTLYALKVNEFITKGININHYIFINQHTYYNRLVFMNMITELLDFYKNCQSLQIQFTEENQYLIIQIIHRDGNVLLEDIVDFLEEKSSIFNLQYNCQSFHVKGLRILFYIDD